MHASQSIANDTGGPPTAEVPPLGPWVVHLACGSTACDLDLHEARALLIELARAIEDIEELQSRRCVCAQLNPPTE